MPLSAGDRLGPFEIVIPVGGIGEVYRAHDSRLNRDVAIKIADAQFTGRGRPNTNATIFSRGTRWKTSSLT